MDLRQVVRQRVLVPSFAGSNPAGPATQKESPLRLFKSIIGIFTVKFEVRE